MNIVIEKGIPMPFIGTRRTGLADALRRMEAGDSFCIDESKRNTVYTVAKSVGRKVFVRKVQAGTLRVWVE